MAESTKTLKAILSAKETVSNALEDVEDSLREAGASSEVTEENFDNLSDATKKVNSHVRAAARGVKEQGESLRNASVSAESFAEAQEDVSTEGINLNAAVEVSEETVEALNQAFKEGNITAEGFEMALKNIAEASEEVNTDSAAASTSVDKVKSAFKEAGVHGRVFANIQESVASESNNVTTSVRGTKGSVEDLANALKEGDANAGVFKAALDKVSNATQNLNIYSRLSSDSVDEEGQSFRAAAAEAGLLAEKKEQVTFDNEKLGTAAKITSELIDKEGRQMMSAAMNAQTLEEFLGRLSNQNIKTQFTSEQLREKLSDVGWESISTAGEAAVLVQAFRRLEDAADDAEDEVNHLEQAMDVLGASALATSLNLGPFSIKLRNLLTTLPTLIATTGALTAALGGLAVAATAAAVSFSMLWGGGALLMAESMAATSEDIEGTMQGLQEVMSQVGDVFQRAMQPLMNNKSVEMFQRAVVGLASAFNMIVQAVAAVQDRLSTFQASVGDAFFSTFGKVVNQMTALMMEMLPVIEDFVVWFNTKFANAIAFVRAEVEDFVPTLKSFGSAMISFIREFTQFGITALKGVLPVIESVIRMLTTFAMGLNSVSEGAMAAFFKVATFAYVLSKLRDTGKRIVKFFNELRKHAQDVFTEAIEDAQNYIDTLNDLVEKDKPLEAFSDMLQQELLETAVASSMSTDHVNRLAKALDRVSGKEVNTEVKTTNRKELLNNLSQMENSGPIETGEAGMLPLQDMRENMTEVQGPSEDFRTTLEKLTDRLFDLAGPITLLVDKFTNLRGKLMKMLPSGLLTYLGRMKNILTVISGIVGGISMGGAFAALLVILPAIILAGRHMDKVFTSIGNTIDWIGKLAMTMLIPLWNMLVDLTELLLSPFLAVADGVELIASGFGQMSGAYSVMEGIAGFFMDIAGFIGSIFSLIGGVADIISDILYGTIMGIAGILKRIVQYIIGAGKWWIHMFDVLGDVISRLGVIQWVMTQYNKSIDYMSSKWQGFMQWLGNAWDWVGNKIEDTINMAIGGINQLIKSLNKIPGMNIDTYDKFELGGSTDASKALEEQKKSAEGDVASGKQVNNYNITNNEYTFGDFTMLPEEKARVKGLVKDALREANRNKRLEGGHIG